MTIVTGIDNSCVFSDAQAAFWDTLYSGGMADSGNRWEDDTTGEVLTVEQAALYLQVSRNTLYEAIAREEIPYRKIGRQIRISKTALVQWLAGEFLGPVVDREDF